MKLTDFDFTLPDELIAQHPAPERDGSRMMLVRRETGKREHLLFRDLPDILGPEYFLVINETRVFPARLHARRPGKNEKIEILMLREDSPGRWLALTGPGRKTPAGQRLQIGEIAATVAAITESGSRVIEFDGFERGENLLEVFEKIGEPPTPPYIRRRDSGDATEDRLRYQTVYARQSGSVAAPTAGLHFTEEVLRRLDAKGVSVCKILLHVGYGTFKPVRAENIEEHEMEPEFYSVDEENAARIRALKDEGRRLVAVGTTSTRCLEYLARNGQSLERAVSGNCNLFIYPGFKFLMLNGLLTNFHLPKSTLFMLASAFAGRELMLDCYREAISLGYRFYSYGDCMLIL
ncbi:MAG: tRNA preQ1(34) S-adenosylmethionine ribosyltransferase-isomerase QueA [Acidobacteria bacterium]|nr:tRNA preQ1(34) S-adenosylmethionine ribosyltransferase-isomerase QueA [Acidobacteriota bacterium]